MDRASRTVLLTGANGGIAQALAKRLAADGYTLVLTDIGACDDVIAANGLSRSIAYTAPCDLSIAEDVKAFLDDMDRHAKVDILINNAAFMQFVPLDEMTPQLLGMFLRVQMQAPFQLSQFVSRHMRDKKWGRIVNVVSNSAWGPSPGMVGYISSKMGLVGLTRSLAVELGGFGICVNAVTPSLTRHPGLEGKVPEQHWEEIKARQAIKRTGKPDDIAGAVSFLISDDAAFMTGQTMAVDGGMIFL